jgi:predicted house-cleaning noncanonical NTP pyrophosphatase (MazG superfamily)
MRKFKQNKLWRDKSVDNLEKQGSKVLWRRLDNEAFDTQLRLKLLEEAEEVFMAKNRQELINELADLFEVIDTFASLNHITKSEILEAQTTKCQERGGFSGRKFVETAEHPKGSFGEQYCLLDPKKYPEII